MRALLGFQVALDYVHRMGVILEEVIGPDLRATPQVPSTHPQM